ncbi:hypothetical protein [Burkholderia phage FLC9]|nr:hypothetical protein [Burkholderia phage FLC9]
MLTIGLAGCNSFNTYDQQTHRQGQVKSTKDDRGFFQRIFGDDPPPPEPQVIETVNPNPGVATRDEKGQLLCPMGKLAAVPELPALPSDQLKQLSPKDKDALITLLTNHIDELRTYGNKVRDQKNAERSRYMTECSRWVRQHQQ